MAKNNQQEKPTPANQDAILKEIQLLRSIGEIETRLALDAGHQRFAQLAEAYLEANALDEAIRICEEGMALHPHYHTAALILAKAYHRRGDRKKAIDILREYLNHEPASLTAHKMMGDLMLEENNIRGAFTHFRLALRIDPINRSLIQQFIQVRDEYHKVKSTLPQSDDDFDIEKPVIRKADSAKTRKEKTIDRVLDEVLDAPFRFPEKSLTEKEKQALLEESSFTPFAGVTETALSSDSAVTDILPEPEKETKIRIQPSEPEASVIPSDTQELLPDDEVIREESNKPSAAHIAELKPVFVDEKGILYFYEDDEVSFEQYKKRYELQKTGKARVINRALLDEMIAQRDISTIKEETQEKITETAAVVEEKEAVMAETSLQKTEREIPEPESEAEVEQAFEDVEMSYRDYLDILTEEEDLIEALMGEGDRLREPPTEEIATDLVSKIVADTMPESVTDPEGIPISYPDYLSCLTDPEEQREATFISLPDEETDENRILSLADFARELDEQDELLDFHSFLLLEPQFAEEEGFISEEAIEEEEESPIRYYDYIKSLENEEEIREAALEVVPAEALESIESESLSDTQEIKAITEPKEAVQTESVVSVEKIIKTEPTGETVKELRKETSVTTEPIVAQPEETEKEQTVQETIEAAEETEPEEEFDIEEEIDPRKASLELVDQLARYGQFGAAYKVCKMLKLKNPTDAKVDRKILELKRLYLWSTQLVG